MLIFFRPMKLFFAMLAFASLYHSAIVLAASPALSSERQWLAALPGGKLELTTLLTAAKRTSETYRGIQSLQSSAEGEELRSRSLYRPLFSAQLLKGKNELEPSSPFEPNRIESSSIGLGLEQRFLTGTTLKFDSRFGPTALGFLPTASSPGTIDFNESRFDINLTQSLWRDSFGASSRLGYKIGFLSAQALRQQRRAELEAYTLALVNEFYEAWLAQSRVRDATETLSRRIRIQKVTRVRASRGTAERPDILEAEAASVSAELELREATERLQESWLKLAVAIKLEPALAAQVNPATIPLVLDSMDPSLESLCQKVGANTGSAALAQALANQKRAEAEAERAEIDKRPDLNLRARYSTNGIDSRLSESASEALRSKHKGWEVALRFELPFGQYEAEGRRQEARSQELRASAQAQALTDEEHVRWGIRCKEISRRLRDLKRLEENAQRQGERGRLEETRFSLGRIRLNDVTRAEEEGLVAKIRLRQEEVSLRRALWSLRELSGQIPEALEALP